MKTAKRLMIIIATLTTLIITSVPTAQAIDDKSFKRGIGFYLERDGQFHPLYWPVDKGKELKTTSVIKTKKTDRFYSYGLDFSKGSGLGYGPLPPHLIGFT